MMSLSYCIVWTILVSFLIQNGAKGHHCNGTNFGDDCYLNCNCMDNRCNVNGTCRGVPCKTGWSGPTCQKKNIALHSKNIKQSTIATLDASYAIDGNKSTYSETFGDRPYLYVDYGHPTKFDTLDVKYLKTGNRLEICLTNDIGDIENRRTFLRNKIRCYDMYSRQYTIRSPPKSRYVVLHPNRDQHTILLVSEIKAQRNNLKFARVQIKPLSTNGAHPASLALDGSTSSYAESPGSDSKLMVNVGRICQFTQIQAKLTIRLKTSYDMYISNSSNIFDGIDDGLYKKFTKGGSWLSSTKWKVDMDTPVKGQYIIFIKRGNGDLRIYDITALELIAPVAAKQSPAQHAYGALLAVDGNENTFSQTFGMNPNISLDLGNITALSSVEMDIELKDKDYEFCVSNKSDTYPSSDFCWNITQLNSTWEMQTPVRGRYVFLSSPGETFLTMKELKVFACDTGTYGKDCTLLCSQCMNYRCDGINGRCIDGCAAGWMGRNCSVICPSHCICNGSQRKCDACEEGRFGEMCSRFCSSHCSEGCDQLSGLCTKCKPGLYGKYCNKTCPDKCKNGSSCNRESGSCFECELGFYGSDCDKSCPNSCNQTVCDIKKGSCVQCNVGYFGDDCTLQCPQNCNKFGCKKDTGDCNGCKLGFAGDKCMVVCDETVESCKSCVLDAKCKFDCPSGCGSSDCNTSTGKCVSCKQGFYGDLCNLMCDEHCGKSGCFQNGTCIDCSEGFYGESCLKQCPEHCQGGSCDMKTGHCLLCRDDFFGNTCIDSCPQNCGQNGCEKGSFRCKYCEQGFYGITCNISCPDHCDIKGCDMNSGYCAGCDLGYYGQNCDKKCPKNCDHNGCDLISGNCHGCISTYYGSQCEKNCPLNCDFKGCSKDYGICYNCKDKYFGNNCEKDCPDKCGYNSCDRFTGTCARCMGNFYGSRCDQKCPKYCNNEGCKPDSGFCISCQTGYFGNFCNKSCSEHCNTEGCSMNEGECIYCEDGYYGNHCNLTCPVNCKAGRCLQFTGRCFECLNGYFGMQCEKSCPTNCDKTGCDVNNGECFKCLDGYYGNKCQMDCRKACSNSDCLFAKKSCTTRSSISAGISGQATQSDTLAGKSTFDYKKIIIPIVCTVIMCTLVLAVVIITGIICTKKQFPGITYKKFFNDKMDNPIYSCSNFDIGNHQSEDRV